MIICNICNKEFESNKELTKHLVAEHKYNTEQVYSYYNYSFESGNAICPICGKEFIMDRRQISGFKKNKEKSIGCCAACSKAVRMAIQGSPLANPEIYNKTKQSLMKHYGVTVPAKSKEVVEKTKATNMERYGVENTFQVPEYKEKSKQTNLRKFGTEYAIGSKEVRDKAKKTVMENYGVENVFQSEEIKEKIKETNLEQLGVEHPMQSKEVQERMKKTNLERIGVEYPIQSEEVQEKSKKTNLERRGVEYSVQSPEVQQKSKETMLERYGVEHPFQVERFKEKSKQTTLKRFGTEYAMQSKEVLERAKKTNLERYGLEYFCQHEDCYKKSYNRISKLNKKFHKFLNENKIESELEFILDNSGYDLKVGNTLIEIDPWFTHNATRGPKFGKKEIISRPVDYHLTKTNKAKEEGYNCIHIFDWDDWNKVSYLLRGKKKIGARKCIVKEINKKEAKEFLENYHLQGSTRNASYAYGLFYNEELIQVMTFGKPRYNKNYEYELLRLCTIPGVSVMGGAGKLLHYFEEQVNPKSIISYCDLSKFTGGVYENIGFKLVSQTDPVRHWYNPKTRRHITDNLLRQRGFDQLHNAGYGKGTSNEQLMLDHDYVEIYDCGQLVFKKEKY